MYSRMQKLSLRKNTCKLVEADAERYSCATKVAVCQRSGALGACLVAALERRVDQTLEANGALLPGGTSSF